MKAVPAWAKLLPEGALLNNQASQITANRSYATTMNHLIIPKLQINFRDCIPNSIKSDEYFMYSLFVHEIVAATLKRWVTMNRLLTPESQ